MMTYRLVLLVAPAGSGKTSLLRGWARAGRWPVAWLTLEPADNRPDRCLARLRFALGEIGPLPVGSPPSPIGGERFTAGVVDLINSLAWSAGDFVLILDDYHVVASSTIHRGLRLLIERAPPQMHVVVASRREPPLQLPRLRVRRQLAQVGPEDLAEWRSG